MSTPVITVENLGKDYVISHLGDGAAYRTLRDTLSQWLRKAKSGQTNPQSEIFSALNDVSFEVQQGEVLGIIGRNGAGKSTLLKILSRITEPTRGRVRLRGRVASLLEVGTGFHPELTGRENIFLNGAILGMTRAEIRRKFDEIVDFSGVEKFIDTPVKRFSSGMYVRLAFAVAAHLEPEILIVDEVLAVGDQEFQKKCLGKMESVAHSEGRTILFVSHNMAAIRQLCGQCLLLERGRLTGSGTPSEMIAAHTLPSSVAMISRGKYSTVHAAQLTERNGQATDELPADGKAFLRMEIETDGTPGLAVECFLTGPLGEKLALGAPAHQGWRLPDRAGRWIVDLPLHFPPLATAHYSLDVVSVLANVCQDHYWAHAVSFHVSHRHLRGGNWDLKPEYGAGHFSIDDGMPTLTSKEASHVTNQ